MRNIFDSPLGAGGFGSRRRGFSMGMDPGKREPHNYPAKRMGMGMGLRKPRMAIHIGIPGFQEGGEVADTPDPQDLRSDDDNLSPHDAELKQVVVEAMLALRGESPDPDKAVQRFIEVFGQDDFAELRQMVLGQHREPDEDDEGGAPDEDEDDSGTPPPQPPPPQPPPQQQPSAGGMQVGGLLRGPGSGQDDRIEASTPSGRRVLLSDGEYVIDAPTVAALGDGSTDAGARRLDDFRKTVRTQAYGHDKQAKPMKRGGRLLMVSLLNK